MSATADGATAEAVSVTAEDDQDEVPLDPGPYCDLLAATLAAEGATGPGEAHLSFVASEAMATLNEAHMGGRGPTDVLSFPVDGADPLTVADGYRVVGDVVICPAVARAQAPDHAGSLEAEVALLVVHGGLHLCGHDHAAPDEQARMWRREQAILERHWGSLPRRPWGEP